MNEIDFLPLEYHQQSADRRQRPWRAVVVLGFATLLGAAALLDYQRRHRLAADLESIRPQYEKAVAQMARLADLQSQARSGRAESDLYTYLRQPWPRTQILAALLAPLPEEVVLNQLKIHQEASQGRSPSGSVRKADPKAEEAELAKLPAAVRDLKRLRAEFDPAQTVVILTGQCHDEGVLHRYLAELGKNELFRMVQLRSSGTAKGERGPMSQFTAVIFVRPGYGQPGGPAPTGKASLARAERHAAETKSSVP